MFDQARKFLFYQSVHRWLALCVGFCIGIGITLGVANIVSANAVPNFPDFSSIANLTLNGNASQVNNVLRVAPAGRAQKGSVWFNSKQPIENGFETTFVFRLSNPGTVGGGTPDELDGADGFAFVIQNSGAGVLALGSSGHGLGYQGVENSFAVEFDTYKNPFEAYTDHIAVHSLGTLPNSAETGQLGITDKDSIPFLVDGQNHTVKVEYMRGTMDIFLDDLSNPVLTVDTDLNNLLDLDRGRAFVGFSAGTGGAFEDHDILSWSFFSLPMVVDIDIKPGSNPNSINCNNADEVITVAILTTVDFDALTVDPLTVRFEGASETHMNNKTYEPRVHEEDVDGDGDTDRVFHFRQGETGLSCTSTQGMLTGQTFDGQSIEGTDDVRMIDNN